MRRGVIILGGLSTATRPAAAALADLPDVPIRIFTDLEKLARLIAGGAVGPLHPLVVVFCRHPSSPARVVAPAPRSPFYSLTPVVGLARGEAQANRAYEAGAQSVVMLTDSHQDGPRLIRAVRYWAAVNRVSTVEEEAVG